MDETQGTNPELRRPGSQPPQGYVYEFGTWRLVPASTVRRTYQAGRPAPKRGG